MTAVVRGEPPRWRAPPAPRGRRGCSSPAIGPIVTTRQQSALTPACRIEARSRRPRTLQEGDDGVTAEGRDHPCRERVLTLLGWGRCRVVAGRGGGECEEEERM